MAIFKKDQPLELKRAKFSLGKDTYINLRELTSQELLAYHSREEGANKEQGNMLFIYECIFKCAIDDDGKQVFDSPDDVKDNFNVGLSTLVEMQKRILTLSGLDSKN